MTNLYAKVKRTEEEKETLRKEAKKRHAYEDNDLGHWLIKGDEQSGDYHSSRQPVLAYCYGTFAQALEFALTFKFWTYWSSKRGGDIQKIQVIDLGDESHPYYDEQLGLYKQ